MRKCFLHIGPPKSGTSSIQHVLKDRDVLRARYGIFVPSSGRIGNGSHYTLVHALAGMPVSPDQGGCVEAFEREIEKTPEGPVVISSEFLWPILSNPDRAGKVAGRLQRLGLDITLILYARNQPQLINSTYTQGVKLFRHHRSFTDYIRRSSKEDGRFAYGLWLDIAKRLGVNLLARPMNEETRRTGLIADFLRFIGAETGVVAIADPKLNPSVGPFAVDVARELLLWIGGPRKLTTKQMTQCGRALRDEMERLQIFDEAYCGPTTEQAREIEEFFRADNDRFAAAMWETSWNETFAGDVGQTYACNDYAIVGVPDDRQAQRSAALRRLKQEADRLLAAPLAVGF